MRVLEILSAPGTAARGSIATYLKQLGLDHFLTGNEFHSISLKQVMDAKDCSSGELPSAGSTPSPIHGNQRLCWIRRLQARSRRCQSESSTIQLFRSSERLDLYRKNAITLAPYPIYTLNPIDPFWVSGAMVGDTGLEMCSRVGTDWRRNATFDATLANGNSPRKSGKSSQRAEEEIVSMDRSGDAASAIANLTIPFDSIDQSFSKRPRSYAKLLQFIAGNHVIEQSSHHHPASR